MANLTSVFPVHAISDSPLLWCRRSAIGGRGGRGEVAPFRPAKKFFLQNEERMPHTCEVGSQVKQDEGDSSAIEKDILPQRKVQDLHPCYNQSHGGT